MLSLIQDAARRGTAIVLVDQSIHSVLNVAHRAYVLRRGRVLLEGPTSELRHRVREIQAAYLAVADPT
jgi:branched-chain amino acid transport system ATP-binding protein